MLTYAGIRIAPSCHAVTAATRGSLTVPETPTLFYPRLSPAHGAAWRPGIRRRAVFRVSCSGDGAGLEVRGRSAAASRHLWGFSFRASGGAGNATSRPKPGLERPLVRTNCQGPDPGPSSGSPPALALGLAASPDAPEASEAFAGSARWAREGPERPAQPQQVLRLTLHWQGGMQLLSEGIRCDAPTPGLWGTHGQSLTARTHRQTSWRMDRARNTSWRMGPGGAAQGG